LLTCCYLINVIVKAKTSGVPTRVVKNRPAAGVLDRDLAEEYKV
jgi:hypothetical protein